MKDKEVVNKFIGFLSRKDYPDLRVDSWPDEENRTSNDIDAIAGQFAIEHTSIDTVENQRRNNAWFMDAIGDIEKELKGHFSFRLEVVIPYEGTQCKDRQAIKDAMKSWLLTEAPRLAEGIHNVKGVIGIPFNFHVDKSVKRQPGLLFFRIEPNGSSLSVLLRKQLDSKSEKLKRYKLNGHITILLIESEDIALMNHSKLTKEIRAGYNGSLPTNVDQIWYADTSIPDDLQFIDLTKDITAAKK